MTDQPTAVPTPDLLPCVFCGNQAVHSLNFQHPKNWHRFECETRFDGCPMNARTHHHETEEQAAVAWNTRTLRVLAPEMAAERDELASELWYVDAVLTRRPALDNKLTRIDKILHVLETAAERDRLVKVNEGLVKAVEFFFKALDEEWLVRNTEKDAEPDWTIKSMPWVQGLAKASTALDEASKPPTEGAGG